MRLPEVSLVKTIRKQIGVNQTELARAANVSQSIIARLESGKIDPSYTKMRKIFFALERLGKGKILRARDIINKNIVAVAKNQPMALGGVPFKIVHVAYANNPNADSLTTEYVFYEWVRDYREKYFLKKGLLLIALGFMIGVCGNIQRKTKVST